MGRLSPRVRSPLNSSRSAYTAGRNRKFRTRQHSSSTKHSTKQQLRCAMYISVFSFHGRPSMGNKIFAIHQCVDYPPILGGLSATLSATCKAAEDDCLERRNSIKPCVPLHVAYKAERGGNELFWSPWKNVSTFARAAPKP